MRHEAIDARLFIENRERLRQRLLPSAVAAVNANDQYPANADALLPPAPNSDLFYLTGIEQEETILLLAPNASDEKQREILFLRQPNESLAIWEGHKLSRDQARNISGVKNIRWLEEFPGVFRGLMCEAEHVYLNSNEHRRAAAGLETRDARFIKSTQRQYPLHRYERLAPLLYELRAAKSAEELRLIKNACAITRRGFLRVLKKIRPGVCEHELEAEFAHEFIQRRAYFAYPPIIASGANNCVLHYHDNGQPCRAGELALLDVAASYANYNADLTRTVPVSGRFTRRQRQVYQAVWRVLQAMIQAAAPGKKLRQWQQESEAAMQDELLRLGLLRPAQIKKQDPDKPALKKYFMHGIGHPLGLDVHDVSPAKPVMSDGWVMTVEPGIYIPDEGFGIRLENDVLVAEEGPVDLMADIPIDPDEIESLMAAR